MKVDLQSKDPGTAENALIAMTKQRIKHETDIGTVQLRISFLLPYFCATYMQTMVPPSINMKTKIMHQSNSLLDSVLNPASFNI